jgi:nicotinamidase-related amidase
MLNTYDHPDGEQCAARAREVVPRIADAVERARGAGMPVIWVNDQYDLWTSDRERLLDHVRDNAPDRELIDPIVPQTDDPFLLKARHSIFYETQLEYYLGHIEVQRLTLIGQVTEQCILYSALDAYVRHFDVRVLEDALIAIDDDLGDAAVAMMRRNMRADVCRVADLG